MPQTPQDFGGPLYEDELRMRDQYGVMPFGPGGVLYSDGYFYAEDEYGAFNLRHPTSNIGPHSPTHAAGGLDEIDGDRLDIDFTPSIYSPTTLPPEADDYNNLSAHLAGIDEYLGILASGGPLDEDDHNGLDTLVHNISEDSYDVITYSGPRVTNITTYEDSSLTKKIRDCDVAYQPTSIRIKQVVTRQYDAAGVVKETETEDVGYDAFGRLKTLERSKTP